MAEIEFAPTGSVEVVNVATPFVTVAAGPRGVLPFSKVTVPVNVAAPGRLGATVAVNVSGVP
jgi:hypothetical protein